MLTWRQECVSPFSASTEHILYPLLIAHNVVLRKPSHGDLRIVTILVIQPYGVGCSLPRQGQLALIPCQIDLHLSG